MHHVKARNTCASRPRVVLQRPATRQAAAPVRRTRAVPELAALVAAADATDSAYVVLGLAAASFVGTFFVAPQFKQAFKEAQDWKSIYADLVKSDLKSITPEEAYLRGKRGSVLLDVRLMSSWQELRAQDSTNIPLYLPIRDWGLASNIRRLGFAFFGIYGTELNTTFAQEVATVIPKGREVVVMCEGGGSLENKSGTKSGFQSRSLKAAWYLQKAGFVRVIHMQGGLGQWMRAGLPTEEGTKEIPAPPTTVSGGRARSKSTSTMSEKIMVGTRSLRR